jgi:hypothetical protein
MSHEKINCAGSEITDNLNNEESKSKIKRKIRAWCSLCYQFFENGPTAKNCQDHLKKGNCNIVECKKGSPKCVRKFPNINSENRHTYCLSQDEVLTWDPICNIQFHHSNSVFMDSKNVMVDSQESIFASLNRNPEFENPWESEKNLSLGQNIISNNNVNVQQIFLNVSQDKIKMEDSKRKVESIFSINSIKDYPVNQKLNGNIFPYEKSDVENHFLNESLNTIDKISGNIFDCKNNQVDFEESLVEEFSKIFMNGKTPEKSKSVQIFSNQDNSKSTSLNQGSQDDHNGVPNLKFENSENKSNSMYITGNYNLLTVNKSSSSNNYLIKDETGIDELLDKVQIDTHIPKTSINKLKTAFKKKGLNTVQIIRLLKNKNKNWNFLYDDFKDVCTQIQGVALYLENILEQLI